MKRCALYVRVSTVEQKNHGLSVDSQIEALKEYCKDNNFIVADVYNDAGFSARKSYKKRPAMQRMIADCQAGKIDLILITKLDRFFRSVKDYYEVMSQIGEIPWRTIWEDYETETSSGVFKVNIMLSVAQSEADRTSERIRAVNQYKRERGDYIGSAPIGYLQNHGKLIMDPAKHDAMLALLKTYIITGSMWKAMLASADLGLKLDRGTANKIVKNSAYCGEASGGYHCEPYITKEEHEIILNHMSQNARAPKYANRCYLFTGLVYCEFCGNRMTGHAVVRTHKNGNKKFYKKYDCQYQRSTKVGHPHLQFVEHYLEAYLLEELDHLYDKHIEEVHAINRSTGNDEIVKAKKSLEAKLQRLAVLYEDGDIDVDDYRAKRDAIKDKIAQMHLEALPEPAPLPNHWKAVYLELDDEHKQFFWKAIIKKITVHKGEAKNPSFDVEFL